MSYNSYDASSEFDTGSTRKSSNFFFILITCLIDVVLILKGEILSWSLVGNIGLKGKKVLSKFFHISLFLSSLQLTNPKKGPNVSMNRFCGL